MGVDVVGRDGGVKSHHCCGSAPQSQSPASECGGGLPLDVPQADKARAAGGRGRFPECENARDAADEPLIAWFIERTERIGKPTQSE